MGSRRAAPRAGRKPNTIPTAPEHVKEYVRILKDFNAKIPEVTGQRVPLVDIPVDAVKPRAVDVLLPITKKIKFYVPETLEALTYSIHWDHNQVCYIFFNLFLSLTRKYTHIHTHTHT